MLNTTLRPAPKPAPLVKANKRRKKTGICPQCGFIWKEQETHYQHCQREMKSLTFLKPKSKRQLYNEAMDHLCRLIVEWRDGCTCVIADSKCSNIPNWGHVIPQGGCATLVHNLSNSFRQCSSHNKIHDKINPLIYSEWYRSRWGSLALEMLKQAQVDNPIDTRTEMDLWNTLIELSDLYDMRYGFSVSSIEEKVEAGFYGPIIREAWINEGRI